MGGKGENSQAPNCCDFKTVEDDLAPKFCDREPKEADCKFDDGNWLTTDPNTRDSWPCNYLVGSNGNPHDIKYGDTTLTQWMWLYLSLLSWVFFSQQVSGTTWLWKRSSCAN